MTEPFKPSRAHRRERDVRRLLLRAPQLARLVERCQFHAAIERELSTLLPKSLAEHCLGCVAHPDRLVVFTGSPIRATPLRFALAGVLPALQQTFGARWQRIQVRILATWQTDPKIPTITATRAGTVERVAETTTDDAPECELDAALQRLAATLQSRSG